MSMFCFNDTATTEIYTLSLHDALPILKMRAVVTVEEDARGRVQLVVTELPYQVNPDNLAEAIADGVREGRLDRKSTRLNSSHANISYAVFCLKKKTHIPYMQITV